jgi:Rrf2 family protein
MQLSQTAEYALRAVVYLAEHDDHSCTTHEIAEGCRMPAGYLSKVLQPLARAGIVTAQRGLGGGYLLAREPGGLTLLEVISAVEPVHRIRDCPLQKPEHAPEGAPETTRPEYAGANSVVPGGGLCALHSALDRAMSCIERCLSEHTIGDMVAAGAASPTGAKTSAACLESRRCQTPDNRVPLAQTLPTSVRPTPPGTG